MFYRKILRPLLFHLPPETAHEIALHLLSQGLGPHWLPQVGPNRNTRPEFGELKRFGLNFANPVGLAAGFDKNGVAMRGLAALGFGFLEVGTVTHLPQKGNPRPRLFRLPLDGALINRQGFNNEGAGKLAARLARRRPNCVLGINIGKSRVVELEEATADYLASFDLVYDHADYIAVNVSSPNTPHLRELQRADALYELLQALQQRNRELAGASEKKTPVPLLVKIAPDLHPAELEAIADVAMRSNISGIIATNTTTSRDHLRTPSTTVDAFGQGGLSGAPLRSRATKTIASLYRLTKGKMTIIGVGGIFSAEDAWDKICAGASLVQLYTGFIYQGFGIAREINEGLAKIVVREKLARLDDAVGCRFDKLE